MSGAIRAALTTAASAAVVLICAATALGHSSLAGTTPTSGAQLSAAPGRVVVAYADPLGAVKAAEVRVGGRDVAGAPHLDPGDRRRLIIPLTERVTGEHRVSWIVVASDGHPMSGELSFTVRAGASLQAIHRVGARAHNVGAAVTAALCRHSAAADRCA